MMMLRAQERSALLDEKVARYKYGKGDTMLNPYGDLPDPIGLDGNVPLAKVVDEAVARIRAARELEFASRKLDARYRYSAATGQLERRADEGDETSGFEKFARSGHAFRRALTPAQLASAEEYMKDKPHIRALFDRESLVFEYEDDRVVGIRKP